MFKKNIFAVIFLVFFVLSITSCKRSDEEQKQINEFSTGGNASFTAESKENKDSVTSSLNRLPKLSVSSNDKNAKKAVITLADQSEITITFSESNTNTNVYLDAKGNKYSFNESNELISYSTSFMSNISKTSITEKQVDEIARDHINKMYGDHILNDYVLESCQDRGIDYNVQYMKKYGAGDWINGELCIVFVDYDGNIKYSNVMSFGQYNDFSESLLDGITKETIEAFARQQVENNASGSSFVQLESIWLQKTDDGYCLDVTIQLENADGFASSTSYFYPLQ